MSRSDLDNAIDHADLSDHDRREVLAFRDLLVASHGKPPGSFTIEGPGGAPEIVASLDEKRAHVRSEVAKSAQREHHCHADNCETKTPPAYFMCPLHWRMVPRHLQALVWKHYNAGQEQGAAGVSAEYLRVTQLAIKFVAMKEKAAK